MSFAFTMEPRSLTFSAFRFAVTFEAVEAVPAAARHIRCMRFLLREMRHLIWSGLRR